MVRLLAHIQFSCVYTVFSVHVSCVYSEFSVERCEGRGVMAWCEGEEVRREGSLDSFDYRNVFSFVGVQFFFHSLKWSV